MLGELTADQIEDLLFSEVVGRIGCHIDQRIYVVPIPYAYDGRHAYMHSGNGPKVAAMRRDPRVCFQVDQVCDLLNWQSVMCCGTFEELGGEAAERARRLLITRFAPLMKGEQTWPESFTPAAGGPLEDRGRHRPVYYRLELSEKTGNYEQLLSPACR